MTEIVTSLPYRALPWGLQVAGDSPRGTARLGLAPLTEIARDTPSSSSCGALDGLEMETPTSIATLTRDARHDDQLALAAARRTRTDGARARWPLPCPSWPWDPPGLHGHSIGRRSYLLDTKPLPRVRSSCSMVEPRGPPICIVVVQLSSRIAPGATPHACLAVARSA
jgi:hypothetical protein